MPNGISARLSDQRRTFLGKTDWYRRRQAQESPAVPNTRLHPAGERVAYQSAAVGGYGKRCFDMAAAISSILLWLPLLLLIAIAVKLADGGPIFYRHRRVGQNGKAFDCIKFRTMIPDSDASLCRLLASDRNAVLEWTENHKLKRDPRITPLGAVLRKTSLDELPQLFNIVKGDMSLVGPRPIVLDEVEKYGECILYYMRARPGLTGAWQVSGRNDVDYGKRIRLDTDYVSNWSFWRDLTIIVSTFRVVLTSRGCY
jgi:exopolysaccharide production protein ExoY